MAPTLRLVAALDAAAGRFELGIDGGSAFLLDGELLLGGRRLLPLPPVECHAPSGRGVADDGVEVPLLPAKGGPDSVPRTHPVEGYAPCRLRRSGDLGPVRVLRFVDAGRPALSRGGPRPWRARRRPWH